MLVWRKWSALTLSGGIRVNYHIDGTGVQRAPTQKNGKTIENVNEVDRFNVA